MKIRKKPVVVDAWVIDTAELQFGGDVVEWVFNEYQSTIGRLAVVSDGQKMVLRIRTLEGMMTANDGDVLVKGVDGEIYAIKRSIFDKTYDVVDVKEPHDPVDFEYDTGRPFSSKTEKKIEVRSVVDYNDGSCSFLMDMDYDTMVLFAKRGLYAAIKEAGEKIVKEHGDVP